MVVLRDANDTFWGHSIICNGPSFNYCNESAGLQVTMVSLEPPKNYTQSEKSRVASVFFVDQSDTKHLLCTLEVGKLWQQPVDLVFSPGEKINMMVVGADRSLTVHLSGKLMTDFGCDDDMSSDDEDWDQQQDLESSEEENSFLNSSGDVESDEEEPELVPTKPQKRYMLAEDESDAKRSRKELLDDEADEDDDFASEDEEDDEEDDDDEDEEDDEEEEDSEEEEVVRKGQTPKKGDTHKNVSQKSTPDVDQAGKKKGDQRKTPEVSKGTPTKRMLQGGVLSHELKVGTGEVAKPGSVVKVYYRCTVQKTGKQVDSCLSGKPFKFKMGKGDVIKGMEIGVESMKVNGKRRITVPAAMGYGKEGAGPIPPNSTLIFDIELKGVN